MVYGHVEVRMFVFGEFDEWEWDDAAESESTHERESHVPFPDHTLRIQDTTILLVTPKFFSPTCRYYPPTCLLILRNRGMDRTSLAHGFLPSILLQFINSSI